MYSGESVSLTRFIRDCCAMFLQKGCKRKSSLCRFPRRNCVLFWDRRNPIFFRHSHYWERSKVFLKRIFVVFCSIKSSFLENFSPRSNPFMDRAPKKRIVTSIMHHLFLRSVKRTSHILSQISRLLVKFFDREIFESRHSFVCSAKHRFYTGELGIYARMTACTGLQERINSEMEASASCCRAKYQRLSLFIWNPPPCGASVSQSSIPIIISSSSISRKFVEKEGGC